MTGNTNGVTYLASGKTIAVGGGGFTKNYLTLKNFYQQGSTAQTLTLTGTAILNLINANFEGNLTVTTPGILLKNSTFSGTTSITRNRSSGSFHCDGGRVEVRFVDFKDNYKAFNLYETNFGFHVNSFLRGCTFKITNGILSKEPKDGNIPHEHVKLQT